MRQGHHGFFSMYWILFFLSFNHSYELTKNRLFLSVALFKRVEQAKEHLA